MTNTRDKEELYIIIKASIEENIKIINIYALNIGPAQCIRQMLTAIKREINSNTIIVGDFNNPLSSTDASSRQNINRKTQALNDTLEHMVLIDIYGALYLKAAEYKIFSSIHGPFSMIDCMLGHKGRLSNLKNNQNHIKNLF